MFKTIKLNVPVEPESLISKYAESEAAIKAKIIDELFFGFVSQFGIKLGKVNIVESIKQQLKDINIEVSIEYSHNKPDEITFIAKQIIQQSTYKIEI